MRCWKGDAASPVNNLISAFTFEPRSNNSVSAAACNPPIRALRLHCISVANPPETAPAPWSCAPGGPGRWKGSWRRRTPAQTGRRTRSWPRGRCPPPWCRTPGAWRRSPQWWWWTWSALWWCLQIDRQEKVSSDSRLDLRGERFYCRRADSPLIGQAAECS